MNAMLEPRMVAVSIHGLASSPHGTSATPDRNTASSQGALIEGMDAIQGALGPKIGPAQAVGITAIRNSSGPGSKFRQIGTGKRLIVTNSRIVGNPYLGIISGLPVRSA
jgi:hypothetical protein